MGCTSCDQLKVTIVAKRLALQHVKDLKSDAEMATKHQSPLPRLVGRSSPNSNLSNKLLYFSRELCISLVLKKKTR